VIRDNPIDRLVLGTKFLKEMKEQMVKIKHNLRETQDRKKRYVDKKNTIREFEVGEHVFFKGNSKKSSLKLGSCT
jgi:hypothetical protein